MEKKNLITAKKIQNWFANLWQSFITEVQDRVFMSWKRIIKFVGISLVPIIYGVVCLVAFWNPIVGIGRAPIGIMNNDHNVILVKAIEPGALQEEDKTVFKVGALVAPNKDWRANDATLFKGGNSVDNLNKIIATMPEKEYQLNNGLKFNYKKDKTTLSVVSMWEVIKGMLLPKTDPSISDENYTFKTNVISQGLALTNIHYISNPETIAKEWENAKYYVQLKISQNYTANLFGWLGSVIADNKWVRSKTPEEWKQSLQKMEIWTTFERNFIFGYYMQTFSTFASGMIFQAIPNMFASLISGNIVDNLKTNGQVLNLANTQPIPGVADNQDYIVLRSGQEKDTTWINNETNIRPYTMFGNIKQDGSYSGGKGEVGGKFISSLEDVRQLKKNGILELIQLLFGSTPWIEQIKFLVDELFKALEEIKDREMLNAYIYRGITGQWTEQDLDVGEKGDEKPSNEILMHREVLRFLKNMGYDTTHPDNLINQVTIFDNQNPQIKRAFMTREYFETNFNNYMAKNPEIFDGANKISELPSKIAAKQIAAITGGVTANDLVGFKLQGQKNGLYGIGLGQFFLVIGLWIGVLMQTFVFDRGKRYAKSTPRTWYLSKAMLMGSLVLIQATLEIWVAYLCGWHMLGLEAIFYIWLWFMASGLMFVVIIQGLWFVVKDETIGKFIAVLIMVLSLAAGGGTFPAFAQFKFFEIVGYLVPFTYVLKGMGAIVYGVSITGTTASTTTVILQNFWPFFIYIALFGTLGLVIGAKNRFKEMDYGSHYGKCVALAMLVLKRDPDAIGFRTIKKTDKNGKNTYQYHWEALPKGLDIELYLKCREMFPFEGRFKWWEQKHHDPVQKPNLSDEDIITRNE